MKIEKKTNFENFPVTTEKSKTIVITGGAGFIGSNLVRAFNNRGFFDIIIVDELDKSDKWKNLRGLTYKDLMRVEEFGGYANATDLDEVDTIIHLGACVDTTEKDADFMIARNYTFTKGLYALAKDTDTRLIYASSAATYGDGSNHYDDTKSVNDYNGSPLNIYGYSKQMVDREIFGIEDPPEGTVGLKFFNVYGPNEDHKGKMMSVVSQNVKRKDILHGNPINLFKIPEGKEAVRDFIYVKDVAAIILKIYDNKTMTGMFNVGTGTPRSWDDLAKAVFAAHEMEPVIEYIDMPEEVAKHYQYYTAATTAKLLKEIGPFKFTTLEDGVKDYVSELKK